MPTCSWSSGGKQVSQLFQAITVQALEGTTGRRMQRLPVDQRQAMVRNLPHQGVLEHVDRLPLYDLLVEEFQPLALGDAFGERRALLTEALEEPGRYSAPEHRGDVEQAPGVAIETVHSGHE
jgi:hypothetical protein